MALKMNRFTYETMVRGDIELLHEHCPAGNIRDHIENILKDSVRVYYDCPTCSGEAGTRPEETRVSDEFQRQALELAKYVMEHPDAAKGMGDGPHYEWNILQVMASGLVVQALEDSRVPQEQEGK